jgi:DNA-binding MarR family transcriptional regulator
MTLVRAFGLLQPDRTPSGQPVPVSEAYALAALAGDVPLSQQELGSRLRLEKSTVSRLVRQLETHGWVARGGDAHDGRMVRLSLTEQGRNAAEDLAEARSAKFARLVAAIPKDRRAVVLSRLSILVECLRQQAGVPRMHSGGAITRRPAGNRLWPPRPNKSCHST